MSLLTDAVITAAIREAWRDSCADDPVGRHEEGGYVLLKADGSYSVERWPRGRRCRIIPPPLDPGNCYNGRKVLAAFHSHPNPPVDEAEVEWEQEPGESDRRWHACTRLPGFVVGRVHVYEIDENGKVRVVGTREEVLSS